MLREHIFSSRTPTDPHFRWRGGDVSRIEALSDAAFAFALTLLMVSSFENGLTRSADLLAAMRDVPALACCFAIIIWIWGTHYRFFRRFGLEDGYTIFLNSVLLFAVMVYVYPLKFLFRFVINVVVMRSPPIDPATGKPFLPIAHEHVLATMRLYGIGYIVIFGLFALMVLHAWRQRDKLELDAVEAHLTRSSIGSHLLTAAVGGLSIAITFLPLPLDAGVIAGIAGMSYALNGPVQWLHGSSTAKRLTALLAK